MRLFILISLFIFSSSVVFAQDSLQCAYIDRVGWQCTGSQDCPNGATRTAIQDCSDPKYFCSDGVTPKFPDGSCPAPKKFCWDGLPYPTDVPCPDRPPEYCPDGITPKPASGICDVQSKTCPDGTVIPVADVCPTNDFCPDGSLKSSHPNGQCAPACMVALNPITGECPTGDAAAGGGTGSGGTGCMGALNSAGLCDDSCPAGTTMAQVSDGSTTCVCYGAACSAGAGGIGSGDTGSGGTGSGGTGSGGTGSGGTGLSGSGSGGCAAGQTLVNGVCSTAATTTTTTCTINGVITNVGCPSGSGSGGTGSGGTGTGTGTGNTVALDNNTAALNKNSGLLSKLSDLVGYTGFDGKGDALDAATSAAGDALDNNKGASSTFFPSIVSAPSASACQIVPMHYKSLQYDFNPCGRLAVFKEVFGWFLYLITVIYIYQIAIRGNQ